MENQTTEQPAQSEQTTAVVQNTDATASTNQEVNFKDLIPQSYREEKSLENFNNMEDLLKSYLHAQKLVGADKIPVPNKHATDDDWKEVFKRLGAPEKPEDYKYNIDQLDQTQVAEFNKTAHQLGLLPEQAEGLIKFYNELSNNQASYLEQRAEDAQLKTETDLKKEFGPQYSKRLDQAKRLAVGTLGEEFLENTILQDGSRLGDNINIIKAFSNLADKLSEDEIIKGDTSGYI